MTRLFTTWLLIAAVVMAAADTIASESDDPVVASFERELNHEPAPRKAVERDDIDDDELYARINKPLQTPEGGEDVDAEEQE